MKVVIAVASYLLGSIPTGYLIVRSAGRRDIRDFGSGSTGATNVLRVKGWRSAILVAAVDILKGSLPALVASRVTGDVAFASFSSFLAVVGHCYPFSIGFKHQKLVIKENYLAAA